MVKLISSLFSVCDLEARVFSDSGILSHANHLPNIVKTQLSFLTVPGSFKIDNSSREEIYRENASELDATNNHFEQSSRVGFIFLFVGVGASITSSLASHESLVANNLYWFKYKETRRKVMTGLGECWKQNMQRIIPEGQVQV